MTLLDNGFTRFSKEFVKVLFAVNLKHSRFWPLTDVNPTENNQVHAMLFFHASHRGCSLHK